MPACPSCGASLPESVGVCPVCSSVQHPQDTPYGQAENKLRGWKLALDAGKLAPAVLRSRVDELQLTDRARQRWWLDPDGVWNRWDQGSWRSADPSSTFRTRSAARPRRWVAASCGVAAIILLGLVAAFLFVGWQASRAAPVLVEGLDSVSMGAAHDRLSHDQEQVLSEFGSPEAFSLLFYEQPVGSGGVADVRQETWMYYSREVAIGFTDGREVRRDPLEVGVDGPIGELRARPQDFTAYMSLEDVVSAAGLSSYLAVPLERAYMPGAAVYYGDGLTFGLVRGELRYLEALAVVEGGSG